MSLHPITEARDASGLTLKELASRAGISVPTLERIEDGRTKRPHDRVLDALAAALETEPGTLELQMTHHRRDLERGRA
ncbi:MAG: helix-turn-helix transcriptional regulator [Patulibacter minatonensis]